MEFDDMFDEEGAEEKLYERDFTKMQQTVVKDGYRTGHSAGQEITLQQGFNKGYRESTHQAYRLAKLRGILNALHGYALMNQDDLLTPAMNKQVDALLTTIVTLEENFHKNPQDDHYVASEAKTPPEAPPAGDDNFNLLLSDAQLKPDTSTSAMKPSAPADSDMDPKSSAASHVDSAASSVVNSSAPSSSGDSMSQRQELKCTSSTQCHQKHCLCEDDVESCQGHHQRSNFKDAVDSKDSRGTTISSDPSSAEQVCRSEESGGRKDVITELEVTVNTLLKTVGLDMSLPV